MIELYTQEEPYHELNIMLQQLMYDVLHNDLRPKLPEDCPPAFHVLVNECLVKDYKKRPNFTEIKVRKIFHKFAFHFTYYNFFFCATETPKEMVGLNLVCCVHL